MITVKTETPYLAITFKDVLNVDSVQNMKEGFGMMGMRFKGKPSKAQIVKMYDEYVKANPVDVLRCLRPKELTLMNKYPEAGQRRTCRREGRWTLQPVAKDEPRGEP